MFNVANFGTLRKCNSGKNELDLVIVDAIFLPITVLLNYVNVNYLQSYVYIGKFCDIERM